MAAQLHKQTKTEFKKKRTWNKLTKILVAVFLSTV
jgi:hypothetical protein